ncbi:MAG: hypothetical protein COA79_01960 [Planctomycetota bacterium]|nr:MAG: hypothetical protein COA79_01960 [Planctomycetota bacterium]
MEKFSKKYQSALEFFGKEKLSQFENEIQSIQRSKNRTSLQVMGHLLLSPKLLLPYSILITCLLGYRFYFSESEVPPIKTTKDSSVAYETLDEFVNGPTYDLPDMSMNILSDSSSTTLQNNETEKPIVTVKRGDTLSTIAQTLLKSSGIKNNHKNRKVIIAKLIDLNQQVKNDHYVRAGWKIRSLSLSNTKQLCSN